MMALHYHDPISIVNKAKRSPLIFLQLSIPSAMSEYERVGLTSIKASKNMGPMTLPVLVSPPNIDMIIPFSSLADSPDVETQVLSICYSNL